MNKHIFMAGLQICALVSAVAWAFTSHKYDCFNVGPCRGDVDFWIWLGDIALYSFFTSWLALFCGTWFCSKQMILTRSRAIAWLVAVMLSPVALVSASWLFNLGVKLADV